MAPKLWSRSCLLAPAPPQRLPFEPSRCVLRGAACGDAERSAPGHRAEPSPAHAPHTSGDPVTRLQRSFDQRASRGKDPARDGSDHGEKPCDPRKRVPLGSSVPSAFLRTVFSPRQSCREHVPKKIRFLGPGPALAEQNLAGARPRSLSQPSHVWPQDAGPTGAFLGPLAFREQGSNKAT